MKKLLTLTALTAALTGIAGAAPVISAQSIIVNPVQNNINVNVWTNKARSGTPNYVPGERIQIYTTVSQDAYVYLFNVDPDGKVDMILPNRYSGGANYVKANTTKVFPPAGAGFTFDIAAPYGLNKVLALASRTPLDVDQIAQFSSAQSGFATTNTNVQSQQQLAQALSIVVNPVAQPVPQNSWDSATAYYNVVARTAQRPVTTYPWTTVRTWRTYAPYQQGTTVVNVYETYNNQFADQGYVLVGQRQQGDQILATYRAQTGATAQLVIRLSGGQFEIRINR